MSEENLYLLGNSVHTIMNAVHLSRLSLNGDRMAQRHRTQLHLFLGSLPPDRFPTLVALGHHVWIDNRDQRFTAGLHVLIDGLTHARTAPSDQHPC
jgi:hypothetical protein